MGTFITVLVLIAAVVAGLGFYLGWFKLSSQHDKTRPDVTLSVNKDKFAADKDKVVDKIKPAHSGDPK
jgi:hypothetical protein